MKFCCISRLYSYRKKLYCVHVVPFFLWYQKSGHSGLEGILNWWWRNITKRKTDKHVPFPTEIHWYCYIPWLCNSNNRRREDSLSTSGMPKSSNCRANWYSVCRTNSDTSFICCCFSMHRNWMYQNILHFLWFRTTFTMWNPQVFVSKTFIRHHQTAVEK